MDRAVLESQWTQIRDILREKFSHLSDEDIREINGRYDQLVAKLQQKYGYSREEAEDRIKSWNFDRFLASQKQRVFPVINDRSYRDTAAKKEHTSSFLKWALILGIPLLLLGAYFLSPARTAITSSPIITSNQAIVEAPADRAISTNLRNVLIAQNISGLDLQNLQITTSNGVVTLSGTVPNTDMRDFIVNSAERTAGVRQVINNLQVR